MSPIHYRTIFYKYIAFLKVHAFYFDLTRENIYSFLCIKSKYMVRIYLNIAQKEKNAIIYIWKVELDHQVDDGDWNGMEWNGI